MPKPARQRELARIHLLKKELGLDRDQYECVLFTVAKVESAAQLDAHGRQAVIRQLQSRLPKRAPHRGKPGNSDSADRRALKKIEALLTDASLPWSYASSIARRMYGKLRLEFCSAEELAGVVAALHRKAVKDLRADLEARLQSRQLNWDEAHRLAVEILGMKPTWSLRGNPEYMSKVYRLINGELRPHCPWPVPAGALGCCQGCRQRGAA